MYQINNKEKFLKIIKELNNYKKRDFTFKSGHILGSMCTQPHQIAINAYQKFLETNLGDPDLFPGTKEMERELIAIISDMLNTPKNSTGLIVSGGTEGNITAMWLVKKITKKREILVPKSAHFSFEKISSLMEIKATSVPINDEYFLDISELKKLISDKTAAIIGIAGSTELGTIDPIPELSDICYDENIFLHVDAAFGGFIIPYLKELKYDVPDFDFRLKGVSSISIDAHKMGYSAIPLGFLLLRKKEWIDEISVKSHCISSKTQSGLLGTRSGGPVAAGYAVMRYLGKKGYLNVVSRCMEVTKYTYNKISEMGLSLVTKPTMNVLGVKLNKLEEIVNKLMEYGWKVNKIEHLSCIRIVLMPQITKKIIDEFIPIFKKTCREVGEL